MAMRLSGQSSFLRQEQKTRLKKPHNIQAMYRKTLVKPSCSDLATSSAPRPFTTDLPSMSKGLFTLRRSCSYRSCSCCRRSSSRSLMILSCSRRLSYSMRSRSRSRNWRSMRSSSRRSFSNWKLTDVLEQCRVCLLGKRYLNASNNKNGAALPPASVFSSLSASAPPFPGTNGSVLAQSGCHGRGHWQKSRKVQI